MAIRVVLAEDSLIVREGLEQLLDASPTVEVVGSCGDIEALLALVDSEAPDVVMTDIRMPPSNTDEGVRIAARLRESRPEIGVIVLSQYSDPAYVLELLADGLRQTRLSAQGARARPRPAGLGDRHRRAAAAR